MKSIAELEAEFNRKRDELTLAHAIAAQCPIPPDFVTSATNVRPWITYKVATLREAIAVFNAFADKVNMEHRRGTFTTLAPALARHQSDEHRGDYCVAIDVHQGEGFGPSPKLFFYARLKDGTIARINADIQKNGYAYSAKRTETRGYRNNLEAVSFMPNAALCGYCDSRISYASGDAGPIKTSANIVYMLVADDGEACSAFSHALAQLEGIAAEFHPEGKAQ